MATTLRVKSQWFKPEQAKSPAENAGAMAFIAWRLALHILKRMREAGFDIDAGPAYFEFVRELLVFLLAGTDRLAYARLAPEARAEFLGALVRRSAEILRDNEADLLGSADDGSRFVEQFNELVGHYAEFGWSEDEGPDLGFARYLGSRLEAVLPAKDRRWVGDQVIAVEAPEAAATLRRAIDGLFSTAPRRTRRAALSGD
jgi:hypothetical protein